jgi:glycine betaine/proline transport system ATP-binding protein
MELQADEPAFSAEPLGESVIECKNIWKVFGAEQTRSKVLDDILSGSLSRDAALHQHGCVVAVEDANFTVRQGEIFCIMGLSGSGKSTLIRHINRLIEPTAGQIMIEGADIGCLKSSDLRELRARKIGMVFQNMALLPHRTVLENTALALELRGDDPATRLEVALSTLKTVGLSDWVHRFPHELSGGMQQRVGIARALASNPDILLMDEPFSALDPMIRRQLQDEFKSLAGSIGKTTLFITHDLDEAIRIGDRIAIMKDGRIVQTGTPEEIVTAPADPYVADFVRGISRVHLVTAGRIMTKPAQLPGGLPVPLAALPRSTPGADLATLLDIYSAHEKPIAIEEKGELLGLVRVRDLIAAIRGTEPKQND